MSYLNERPRKKVDLAALLRVCPHCLGDLVERSDFAGEYYLCRQCGNRARAGSRVFAEDPDYATIRDEAVVDARSLYDAA